MDIGSFTVHIVGPEDKNKEVEMSKYCIDFYTRYKKYVLKN